MGLMRHCSLASECIAQAAHQPSRKGCLDLVISKGVPVEHCAPVCPNTCADKEAADDHGGSDNGIEADFRSSVPSGSTATDAASDVDPNDAMWRDFEPVGDAKGR